MAESTGEQNVSMAESVGKQNVSMAESVGKQNVSMAECWRTNCLNGGVTISIDYTRH